MGSRGLARYRAKSFDFANTNSKGLGSFPPTAESKVGVVRTSIGNDGSELCGALFISEYI